MLTLIGIILTIGSIIYIFDEMRQRRIWNNGICAESGAPWVIDEEPGNHEDIVYTDHQGNFFFSSRERMVRK